MADSMSFIDKLEMHCTVCTNPDFNAYVEKPQSISPAIVSLANSSRELGV